MFTPTPETGKLWTKIKLKALAAELAKGLKTEADLNQFSRMLTKLTVETALNAELTDHLG
ncbi:transposase [Escherichia coli]|nr:transposase [Escherichia coli]